MTQEQALHEKQKTKMRLKNISRENFSFTNFDPKLRAKTDTDNKLIKLQVTLVYCVGKLGKHEGREFETRSGKRTFFFFLFFFPSDVFFLSFPSRN